MTLLEFLTETYWPEHALTLKKASLEQLRYSVESFGRHLGRPATIDDLDRLIVLDFLANRAQKVAAATVNKDRRSILCLWRLAADLDRCKWPTRIPKAKCPQTVPHTFSMDEMRRLVTAAAHFHNATWWRSLLLALFDSASRVTAMLAVRICDVDFAESKIRLRPETTKTNVEQVLTISREDTGPAIAAQCLGRERDELIWPWPHHRRRLFIHFRRLCESAMPPVRLPRFKCFHSLRRTTATLIAANVSLEAASRHLGHSNLKTTRGYVDQSQIDPMTWLPPRP